MSYKGYLIPHLKDTFIIMGWIAGILLIGALSWFLTRSIRTQFLQDSINRALIKMEDPRSLESPLVSGVFKNQRNYGPLSPQGRWFSLKDKEGRLLFFTLISGGTFLPCAAILNSQGKVSEIIPLDSRGKNALSQVSPGIIKLYLRRIEEGYE